MPFSGRLQKIALYRTEETKGQFYNLEKTLIFVTETYAKVKNITGNQVDLDRGIEYNKMETHFLIRSSIPIAEDYLILHDGGYYDVISIDKRVEPFTHFLIRAKKSVANAGRN